MYSAGNVGKKDITSGTALTPNAIDVEKEDIGRHPAQPSRRAAHPQLLNGTKASNRLEEQTRSNMEITDGTAAARRTETNNHSSTTTK